MTQMEHGTSFPSPPPMNKDTLVQVGVAGALGVCLYTLLQRRDEEKRKTPAFPPCPFGGSSDPASLCIVTCSELLAAGRGSSGSWSVAGLDEGHLYRALKSKGVEFHVRAWDDPKVDWSEYKMVVTRTVWDYSESEARAFAYTRWLAHLTRMGVRVCNNERVQAWNVHKTYLKELQEVWDVRGGAPGEEWEVATIPFVLCKAGTMPGEVDLAGIMKERGWSDVMIKPAVGGGSRDCLRVLESEGASGVQAGQAFLESKICCLGTGISANSSRAEVIRLGHVVGGSVGGGTSPSHHSPPPSPSLADSTVSRLMDEAVAMFHEGMAHHEIGGLKPPHVPQDMMVLPYLSTVETQGELTAIWVAGVGVVHSVTKVPAVGDFRCQEEYKAIAMRQEITAPVQKLVERVLEGALAAVEKLQPPLDTPSSPSAAPTILPSPLPPTPLLFARCDFLPITPYLHERVFGKGYEGRVPCQSRTPLLMLEVELIEPALFFKEALAYGVDLPSALVDAIIREISK